MPSVWTVRAASTVSYHATISSKRAVRRTTCASFVGAMRPRAGASLARRSSFDMGGLLRLVDHAVLDGADALDLDPDDVPGAKEGGGLPRAADAAWGPGGDHVARLERER